MRKTSKISITGKTSLFGILANPVSHSRSPAMHNLAFSLKKVDAVYVPIHLTEAGPFLKKALLAMNIKGLSVTIPHKMMAAKIADTADQLVELCKAANTLIIKNGKIHALNTDGPGAILALSKNKVHLQDRAIIIYGYGGSARAIAGQLASKERPGEIIITGRNRKKASKLVRDIKKHTGFQNIHFQQAENIDKKCDLLIQTSPIGMSDQSNNLPDDLTRLIDYTACVFDIVYIPKETALLKLAKKKKKKVIYGYEMLLYQAVLQFEEFCLSLGLTKKAPVTEMKQVVLDGI